MARRGRATGTLAQLERQLATLNAQRGQVIRNIHAAVAGLTAGASYLIEAEKRELEPAARKTRKFSKAARAKLRAAAKARWAAVKKAGKTRLG